METGRKLEFLVPGRHTYAPGRKLSWTYMLLNAWAGRRGAYIGRRRSLLIAAILNAGF